MAYTPTILPPGPGIAKSALCDKMGRQADALLDGLDNFKEQFNAGLEALRNYLKKMSWSPPADVLDKINQIGNKAADLIPNVTDFDKIIDMLNECAFLQNTGDASTLVKQTLGPFVDNARTAIDGITGAMPEFNAVNTFNELQSQILNKKIDTSVLNVQQALACLYHICGVDISARLDRLNGILDSCNMNSSGQLDAEKVLYASGITDPVKQASFNGSKAAVNNIYNGIGTNITQGVSRVNSLTKDSPLF